MSKASKKILSNILKIIIFSAIPILLIILVYIFQNFSQTATNLSHSLINRTIKKTELQLNLFFNPVRDNLKITCNRGKTGLFNEINVKKLNSYFIPFLKNTKQSSSLLIANSKGEEYMLLQEDSTWQNRITSYNGSKKKVVRYRWVYLNSKAKLLDTWVKKSDKTNNPLKKSWYKAAANIDDKIYGWTDPYQFKTTKDAGITTSIKWDSFKHDTLITYVVAYDIMLKDISEFTSNLKIGQNGKAFIFTDKGKIIGLPKDKKFQNPDSVKAYILKNYDLIGLPNITTAINKWKQNNKTNEAFSFNDDKWWCQVEKYSLNPEKSFFIAVIVPEKDFLSDINRTKKIIIGGFLFIVLLVLIVISGYIEKRKTNKLLSTQKKEISEKNEELNQLIEEVVTQRDEIEKQKDVIEEIHHEVSQSIDYATRLQLSILSEEKLLAKYTSDHFVLFKPKDKVSGDFYWWTHIENHTIITVADCTGHGVPGAFMSMLGISFLREIVQKEYITHTGVILRKLRKEVIKALKQTGDASTSSAFGNMKDGMDMAIISINHETNVVQFSGANNPLYIITRRNLQGFLNLEGLVENTNNLLYEIKPDKMPIAIYERMDNFTTHKFKLEKGDQLYMFSDGFADQFGGPKGKKFKYKPFKRLLLENADKSMAEQKEILNKTFEDWKGNLEQIDDVTIIGIKI